MAFYQIMDISATDAYIEEDVIGLIIETDDKYPPEKRENGYYYVVDCIIHHKTMAGSTTFYRVKLKKLSGK